MCSDARQDLPRRDGTARLDGPQPSAAAAAAAASPLVLPAGPGNNLNAAVELSEEAHTRAATLGGQGKDGGGGVAAPGVPAAMVVGNNAGAAGEGGGGGGGAAPVAWPTAAGGVAALRGARDSARAAAADPVDGTYGGRAQYPRELKRKVYPDFFCVPLRSSFVVRLSVYFMYVVRGQHRLRHQSLSRSPPAFVIVRRTLIRVAPCCSPSVYTPYDRAADVLPSAGGV